MNKSEAKKRFKDLCYEKDLIECAKDTDFDKLIDEIYESICADFPVEEKKLTDDPNWAMQMSNEYPKGFNQAKRELKKHLTQLTK